jgi:hypothetical protein
LPGEPAPQSDASGAPMLTLADAGATALLATGARLPLSDAQRNDLEVAVLEQLDGVDRIDFEPGAFTPARATLSVADGQGGYQVLASTTPSTRPPFDASFSVSLSGDQRTRAIAALNGTTGLLKIDYALDLSAPLAATLPGAPATVTRTIDVARWFGDGSGATHIKPGQA